ncbi:putative cAMP-specific 3',5'-cyclic phosphodiesterase 4C [Blattamonas nauphoetae]|uniref:cAMP-specific 3',5'-cyclic phosphodiesterase 4C n=1 Tax=Blattamonas nauphoetae TaxID=2049346 RepID=A0ABQ9X4V0_9EUKA|nr:putative cAMP-specific 3',5'-cyclic phosphodiesterase 4C [Blattamonas nauphoetae]
MYNCSQTFLNPTQQSLPVHRLVSTLSRILDDSSVPLSFRKELTEIFPSILDGSLHIPSQQNVVNENTLVDRTSDRTSLVQLDSSTLHFLFSSVELPDDLVLFRDFSPEHTQMFYDYLQFFGTLAFDLHKFDSITNHHPLAATLILIFVQHDLFQPFQIDLSTFIRFAITLEQNYLPIEYHSAIHAADVLHFCHFSLCSSSQSLRSLTKRDLVMLFTAAAAHDVQHPGRYREFLISHSHPIALTYNDISPLENFHASTLFTKILSSKETNFIDNFSPEDKLLFRQTVIELILATDLKYHQPVRTRLELLRTQCGSSVFQPKCQDERVLVMKSLLMSADLNVILRPRSILLATYHNLYVEMYKQGDVEIAEGQVVDSMYDRKKDDVHTTTLQMYTFVTKVVLPFIMTVHTLLDCFGDGIMNVQTNLEYWESILNEESANVQKQ